MSGVILTLAASLDLDLWEKSYCPILVSMSPPLRAVVPSMPLVPELAAVASFHLDQQRCTWFSGPKARSQYPKYPQARQVWLFPRRTSLA